MRLLNNGVHNDKGAVPNGKNPTGGPNANNTGTGGSSSDGSSGHASMSDSQTSGSPPAEYARLMGNGGNSNYKAVLKSVPEDDLSTVTTRMGAIGADKSNESSSYKVSLLNGSKKSSSSRSRHRNNKV